MATNTKTEARIAGLVRIGVLFLILATACARSGLPASESADFRPESSTTTQPGSPNKSNPPESIQAPAPSVEPSIPPDQTGPGATESPDEGGTPEAPSPTTGKGPTTGGSPSGSTQTPPGGPDAPSTMPNPESPSDQGEPAQPDGPPSPGEQATLPGESITTPTTPSPTMPADPPASPSTPSPTTPNNPPASSSTTTTTAPSVTTTTAAVQPVDQAPITTCGDLTLTVSGLHQVYDYWIYQTCFYDPEGGSVQAFSTQGSFGSVTAPSNAYCGSVAPGAWCWQYTPQGWDGTPYWDSFTVWAVDAAGNQSVSIKVDLCFNC